MRVVLTFARTKVEVEVTQSFGVVTVDFKGEGEGVDQDNTSVFLDKEQAVDVYLGLGKVLKDMDILPQKTQNSAEDTKSAEAFFERIESLVSKDSELTLAEALELHKAGISSSVNGGRAVEFALDN